MLKHAVIRSYFVLAISANSTDAYFYNSTIAVSESLNPI